MQPRIGIVGEARMPLAEVIERVLKSDPDLRISRIAREQAGYQITAAQGAYDPVLGLGAYRTKAVSPVASILGGTASGKLTQTEINVTPQVTGLTPWGGSYNFKFSNSRQQSDSPFNTLNPQYPATAALNLTQPLWRGLRFDVNRHRIEVARAGQQLSREQLRQRVIERVTMAINAYWELDFAWNLYQVQTRGRPPGRAAVREQPPAGGAGRARADRCDGRADAGRDLSSRTCSLAQQALTAAENNLKSLMLPESRGHAVGRRDHSRDPGRHLAESDSAAGRRQPGALVAAGARTKCDRAGREQARRAAQPGAGEAADQRVRESLGDGSRGADAAGRDESVPDPAPDLDRAAEPVHRQLRAIAQQPVRRQFPDGAGRRADLAAAAQSDRRGAGRVLRSGRTEAEGASATRSGWRSRRMCGMRCRR